MSTEFDRDSSRVLQAAHAASRLLLPSRCLACRTRAVERAGAGGVCRDCWRVLPLCEPNACEICDEPLSGAGPLPCGRCLVDPPAFDRLRAAAPYRGSARRILLAFKFGGADYLARHLAAIMVDRLGAPEGAGVVLAVPATRRARRRRDHAAESLASAVAARLRIPFEPHGLAKTRETVRQSLLAQARRAVNVRGAFVAARAVPETVLLVDDVATSGATARECARALRAAGARRILVWCFGRASRIDGDFETEADVAEETDASRPGTGSRPRA